MNQTMREAFTSGSGVDPLLLKSTLTLIAVAVILVVCTWVVVQLMDAYRNEELSATEVTLGAVKLLILAALVLFAIV